MRFDATDKPSAVLIFANGLGDYLLNLPAVRALAAIYNGRLGLLSSFGARNRFFLDINFKFVVETEFATEAGSRHFDAASAANLCGPCDVLISLNPWHSSSVDRLIDYLRPEMSIGFFKEFSKHVPLDFGVHNCVAAFSVPKRINRSLTIEHFASGPSLSEAAMQFATTMREMVGVRELVVVHADTAAEKMWAPARLECSLLELLRRREKLHVFLVGIRNPGVEIGHKRIHATYGIPFTSALALVSVADAFLGIDSCFLHAADLFRIPGVGLFGPTSSREFGFYFSPHYHLQGDGHLEEIWPMEVADAVEAILG
jgi:hypothetical protein